MRAAENDSLLNRISLDQFCHCFEIFQHKSASYISEKYLKTVLNAGRSLHHVIFYHNGYHLSHNIFAPGDNGKSNVTAGAGSDKENRSYCYIPILLSSWLLNSAEKVLQ
jgi:hypothetical protein